MSAADSALASAKASLAGAEKKFPTPKAEAPAPKHEYSSAPYSLVRKAMKPAENVKKAVTTTPDVAEGIKAVQDNIKQYKEATKNE